MIKKIQSVLDLSKAEILHIFDLAVLKEEMFSKYQDLLKGKVLASLFFQPSTRTQFSFQAAFQKLGGSTISIPLLDVTRSGAPLFETTEDMATIMNHYCDVMVVRAENLQIFQDFYDYSSVPFISAGFAQREHPTQALTDLFTMKQKLNHISGLNILIIGDYRHRVIHSLLAGLSYWENITIHILCAEHNCSPEDMVFSGNNKVIWYTSLEKFFSSSVCSEINCIYITRYLDEIIENDHRFMLSLDDIDKFPRSMVIMSPLPRTAELPKYFDALPNSVYFEQALNGLYIRAALFLHILNLA